MRTPKKSAGAVALVILFSALGPAVATDLDASGGSREISHRRAGSGPTVLAGMVVVLSAMLLLRRRGFEDR